MNRGKAVLHEKEVRLTYEVFTKCRELRDKKLEEIELIDIVIKSLSEKLDNLKEKKD